MAYERVSFPEALRVVAEKYGIEVKETKRDTEAEKEKSALFRVNRWAARIFKKHLWSERGSRALEYLTGRGFSKEILEQFLLGYAPPGWENLLLEAKKSDVPIDLLERGGLIIQRPEKSGYYDRFRNRVIFPILDTRERVLGFGGRALGDDQPKYLNSPETAIFNKGSCLYGFPAAREAILQERRVALVEGYTDCLMAHEKGIKWAVATLGTSLTPFQVRLLKRYADEAVLVFDADSAGESASDRGFDIFLAEEMEGKVAVLTGGLDPCDFLQKEGPQAFLKLISEAREVFDWKLEIFAARLDLDTARGRNELLQEMVRLLEGTKSALSREMLIARSRFIQGICDRLGVSEEALRQQLRPRSGPGRMVRSKGAQARSATGRIIRPP
jgi:DNA primase